MTHFWLEFWEREEGQDISRYTLLVCILVVLGIATYIGLGGQVKGMWATGNRAMSDALVAVN